MIAVFVNWRMINLLAVCKKRVVRSCGRSYLPILFTPMPSKALINTMTSEMAIEKPLVVLLPFDSRASFTCCDEIANVIPNETPTMIKRIKNDLNCLTTRCQKETERFSHMMSVGSGARDIEITRPPR